MASLPPGELARLIRDGKAAGQRAPVYLIHGDDARVVADAALALRDALAPALGGPDSTFRFLRLGSGEGETSAAEITAQLNTVSMFGAGKLAWVGPLEELGQQDAAAFERYAKSPNPQSSLILTVALGGDSKTAAQFPKSPLAQACADAGMVVHAPAPTAAGARTWLAAKARERGIAMDARAAELLTELCASDPGKMEAELEKLAVYAAADGKITADDVAEVTGDWREESIWNLTKAFAARDLAASREALDNLLRAGTPPQVILKMLTTELLRMAAALDHRARGSTVNALAAEIGASPWALKDAWSAAAQWNRALVVKGLRRALEATLAPMQSGVAPETALTALLVSLLPRRGTPAPAGKNAA